MSDHYTLRIKSLDLYLPSVLGTIMTRQIFFVFSLLLCSTYVQAAELWATLPATPAPIAATKSGYATINGARLYYAVSGHGSPVLLLHGGLSNSDYWGLLEKDLVSRHTVIVIDSRGHGRSSRDNQPYSYNLMSNDVIKVLDLLNIPESDIVGWSDGAIIGLDLAMRYPERIGKVFAFAPNTQTSGVKEGVETNPTFAAFIKRAGEEYSRLSPTPGNFDDFVEHVSHMWAKQPNWSDAELLKIHSPVLIADGDHDEAIKREHLEHIAGTIPGAGLLIMPGTSHFAFIQDPSFFNTAVQHFLDEN